MGNAVNRKGSRMTDVTYAEALQAEATDQEVTATQWVDSDGNALTVGATVRVSNDQADGRWDYSAMKFEKGREFDFAEVTALNENGTVTVLWDSAGCGCSGDSSERIETADHLTLSNESEVDVYYRGVGNGKEEGRKENQHELREVFGLPQPTED